MRNLSGHLRFVTLVVLAALVLSASASALAQTRDTDVPILVAGEDEDTRTIKRSDEIFQRVIAEIKGVLSRAGFSVVEEAAVAVDQDWEIRDRRPKKDLLDLAMMMNRSSDATHGVRAVVLVSIRAKTTEYHTYTPISIDMRGAIYDIASGRFVDNHHRKKEHRCVRWCCNDGSCVRDAVGDAATKDAAVFGDVIAGKLAARYRDGFETPYTVTFRRFERRESVTIVAVMADEFPGYKSHRLMRTDQGVRRYAYVTTAKPAKLEQWLTQLLAQMNFDPDREIRIAIEGTDITVEKILPTPDRPRSGDEKALFK